MPTLDPPVDPRVETLLEPSEEMPPCDAPDPSPSGSGEARRTPRAAAAIRPAAARVEALIGDARLRIGGALQTGSRLAARCAQEAGAPRLPTGVAAVDRLLGGGFPRGHLAEITGPPSSGRTSLALALAAATTRAGEVAAWVDLADALDPASLEAAGAVPERVLWVRAPRAREALRCAERLLLARGFALVVLDLERPGATAGAAALGTADGLRLARLAAAGGAAVVRLARTPLAGGFAALVVSLGAPAPRFAAEPTWLEGLDTRVSLVRHRLGRAEGFAPACWKVAPVAPEEEPDDPGVRPRPAAVTRTRSVRSRRERCA